MSGLFGGPKQPSPVPVVNPADTANRLGDAMARRLQTGGSNADNSGAGPAPVGGGKMPTLTGLN